MTLRAYLEKDGTPLSERLFKVLNADGSAYHGGTLQWSLPNGQPGAWHEVAGVLVPCERGLHLCRERDLITWLGPALYLAEYGGERLDAGDKIVVRRARLVSRVETWNDRTARLFAVACARRALERERGAGREPDARSWAALDVANAFAEGQADVASLGAAWNAAWAVAEDAAGAAAKAAASRNAAWVAVWDAAGAAAKAASRNAAWAVAWAAAGAAARNAAWNASRNAAWVAAWDAAGDAAWDAERQWQTAQLMAVLFP